MFRGPSSGFRVSGFRSRVSGFGLRISGFGFRGWDLGESEANTPHLEADDEHCRTALGAIGAIARQLEVFEHLGKNERGGERKSCFIESGGERELLY